MSLPVVYLPEAEDDIAYVHAAYELQRTGLGDQFLESLRKQIDRVESNPYLYGILKGDVRATPLRRFPYIVYYRIQTADVLVIAVLHGRRSSRVWQRRV
jgi:plasmid stabilization system protein ParE